MALNANVMTTVAALRGYLQASRTEGETGELATAVLEEFINRVSSLIESHCDRQLIAPAAAQTFTLPGDGRDVITLPEYPLVSVTSVTNLVDGEAIAARPDYTSNGYVIDDLSKQRGQIRLYGYATNADPEGVRVVAVTGYDATTAAGSTPEARRHRRALDDLENACLQWCALLWRSRTPSAETVTTEALAFTVREQAIPTRVREILRPYRRAPL